MEKTFQFQLSNFFFLNFGAPATQVYTHTSAMLLKQLFLFPDLLKAFFFFGYHVLQIFIL